MAFFGRFNCKTTSPSICDRMRGKVLDFFEIRDGGGWIRVASYGILDAGFYGVKDMTKLSLKSMVLELAPEQPVYRKSTSLNLAPQEPPDK